MTFEKSENYKIRILKGKPKRVRAVFLYKPTFATHLLEGGTKLRYKQESLRHKSSITTEIYTHVSTKDLSEIKCPLDTFISNKQGMKR